MPELQAQPPTEFTDLESLVRVPKYRISPPTLTAKFCVLRRSRNVRLTNSMPQYVTSRGFDPGFVHARLDFES